MKCLIFTIGFLVAITCVQAAFFPKFPKLVMKYDNDSEEDGNAEVPLFKLPKLNLFDGKPSLKEKLADKMESFKEKDTLFEKLINKKEDKFEDRLLDFFDDKSKAKTVFEKLQGHNFGRPVVGPEQSVETSCRCKERTYDHCDDNIRYFS